MGKKVLTPRLRLAPRTSPRRERRNDCVYCRKGTDIEVSVPFMGYCRRFEAALSGQADSDSHRNRHRNMQSDSAKSTDKCKTEIKIQFEYSFGNCNLIASLFAPERKRRIICFSKYYKHNIAAIGIGAKVTCFR